MSRHKALVEKRLEEKFHVDDDLKESQEQREINEMIARVAKLAADDNLREDGFFFCSGKYIGSRKFKFTPGMVLRVLQGHEKPVQSVAVQTDCIVTFGIDGICVWDMVNNTPKSKLNRTVYSQALYSVAGVISDANIICCAGDAPICIDKCSLQVQKRGTFGHDNVITCCCLSSNKNILVTGSMDTTCIVWNATSLEILHILPAHPGGVSVCQFSADGRYLVTAGKLDNEIKRWDLSFWTLDQEHDGNKPFNAQVNEKRPAKPVFARGNLMDKDIENDANPSNESVHIVDKATGTCTISPKEVKPDDNRGEKISQVKLNTHSEEESESQVVDELPEEESPNPLTNWTEREKYNRALDTLFSPEVSLEALTLMNHIPEFAFNDDWVYHRPSKPLQLPPLYSFTTIDGNEDLREHFDDPAKLAQLETINILELLNPLSAQSHPLSQQVHYDRTNSRHVPVLVFENISKDGDYVQHSHSINGCVYSPNDKFVISVSSDRSIKSWDSTSGEHQKTIRDAHEQPILCCAMAKHPNYDDKYFLVTGSSDTFIKLWDAIEMTTICIMRGHYDAVLAVVFSASGHTLYSASKDTQAIKWQIVPTVPDAPVQPEIVHIDCHSINIAWIAPLANGAPILKYYILTSKAGGAFESLKEVPPDETKSTMDMLDPGIVYAFKVAAINAMGSSDYSISTTPCETLAYRPSKIAKPCSVSDVTTRSVVLLWPLPSANGAPITHYHFRCIPEDPLGIDTPIVHIVSVDDIERAFKAENDAIAAEEIRKAQERADRQAAKTRSLRTAKSIERSKKLQQQAQARIDKQQLQERASMLNCIKYKLPCVLPGTIYQFQIAAENRCGVAEFSVASMFIKTASSEPDAPGQPTISNITPWSIQVIWAKPRTNGSDIVQYNLFWEQQDIVEIESIAVLARSLVSTEYKISNLQPGKWVRVRLTASNIIDKKVYESPVSPWSEKVLTLPTVPSAVSAPTLENPTSHSFRLSFTAPCDNGRPILKYHATLCYEESSFGVLSHRFVRQYVWEDLMLENEKYSIDICQLIASTKYVITVSAENCLGKGDYSPMDCGICTKSATVPPLLNEAPVVSNIKPTSASLKWTEPKHNGGNAIIGYIIEYTSPNTQATTLRVSPTKLEVVLDFLKPKTTYAFRVAAVNGVGSGEFSIPSLAMTTPSLVDYTVREYFNNRPPEEHVAADKIRKCYVNWLTMKTEQREYFAYLKRCLSNWNLL